MKRICFISIDVERDNFGNQNTFSGVENLANILDVFLERTPDHRVMI